MIAVVDYRAGNAPSVLYALEHLGLGARLVSTAGEIAGAERIILPGVGAARATIDSLVEQDLVGALTDRVQGDRVPFLGICIGLQVLFDHSEEGDTPGLGWVPGRVRRFPDTGRVP
jgi:glutamine amidotransferase